MSVYLAHRAVLLYYVYVVMVVWLSWLKSAHIVFDS